jgi:hypothetical protein
VIEVAIVRHDAHLDTLYNFGIRERIHSTILYCLLIP